MLAAHRAPCLVVWAGAHAQRALLARALVLTPSSLRCLVRARFSVASLSSGVRSSYMLAAPMLYESKMDGSLAAHATQTNLRLVKDGSPQGVTVRHDHSLRRALNRGQDFKEGDQTEFVEDHGFLIETSAIGRVIDPSASFTLEYLDMIMTIRANGWKALFVPTARLEFRITEFSWRDIPYFMYAKHASLHRPCLVTRSTPPSSRIRVPSPPLTLPRHLFGHVATAGTSARRRRRTARATTSRPSGRPTSRTQAFGRTSSTRSSSSTSTAASTSR